MSKLDRAVWDEFYRRWNEALLESEALLAAKKHTTVAALHEGGFPEILPQGLEKEWFNETSTVKVPALLKKNEKGSFPNVF